MEEVISYIVKNLVKNPDKVIIEQKREPRAIIFSIIVDDEDLGKVIGKNGKIINSIRIIAKSLATREDGKIIVKVKNSAPQNPENNTQNDSNLIENQEE